MAAQGKSSEESTLTAFQAIGCLLLLIVLPALLMGVAVKKIVLPFFAARAERQYREGEERLRRGTIQAYEGAARVDVTLAEKAAARGNLDAAEERAFRAKAKLEAPQAAGKIGPAAEALQGLESKHGESFKPIRRRKER